MIAEADAEGEGTFMHESDRPAPSHSLPLRKFLEGNIILPADVRSRLYCQVVTDTYLESDWKNEPVGPRRGHNEYLSSRHNIFVFMQSAALAGSAPVPSLGVARLSTAGSPTKRRNEYVLVFGMTAWEYSQNGRESCCRSYIQYVDTTGLFRPRRLQRSLTRAILCAYLRYCRQIIKVFHVHLFASAQPSLLFCGSEFLPRKRVLDSARLINWWLALMHSSLALSSSTPVWQQESTATVEGFVYCPGEDDFPLLSQSLRANVNTLNRMGGVCWHFGLPYDAGSSAFATIPLFEDDPKWRHYEAAAPSGDSDERPSKRRKRETETPMSVEEFFKSLASRMEFRRDPAAFVTLRFPENDPQYTAVEGVYGTGGGGGGAGGVGGFRRSELALFSSKQLRTMRFDSELAAAKSSMYLWSWLKLRGATPFEIRTRGIYEEADVAEQNFILVLSDLASRSDLGVAQPTNDVQTLIRKKFPAKLIG